MPIDTIIIIDTILPKLIQLPLQLLKELLQIPTELLLKPLEPPQLPLLTLRTQVNQAEQVPIMLLWLLNINKHTTKMLLLEPKELLKESKTTLLTNNGSLDTTDLTGHKWKPQILPELFSIHPLILLPVLLLSKKL